jgi:crossover junction endodeoxyribonuclease RuvC
VGAVRTVVSIDPGKTGAVALFSSGLPLWVQSMPTIPAREGGREAYDLQQLATWLELADEVVAEAAWARPFEHGGSNANFQRGYGLGLIEGICTSLVIPYTLVSPQRWQKAMHAGVSGDDTKQQSIIAAQRLFPGVSLLPTARCRKPSHGMAEALLIGAYHVRQVHSERPVHG